ncbi:MAG TPA: diaminobutyrate acetyltransferase [Nitrosopumilaceae archaeon]|nr:diaminobutyrate acetyltransferase [Nitrosopumilaceae archaeon]
MEEIKFSKPKLDEAKHIFQLIKECPPLDLNSEYLYLLLCQHFSDTCVVAKINSKIVGFVSGYLPPERKNTLFVWQVAVVKEHRGKGLASKMIKEIIQRPELNIEFVEATITPSNFASKSLFTSIASAYNSNIEMNHLFTEEKFGNQKHEEENLVTIGPIVNSKPLEVNAQ